MNQRDCVAVIRHPNYAWKTRNLEGSLRKLDHLPGQKSAHLRRERDYLPTLASTRKKFHVKFCCHQREARLLGSKFSTIVLGGTAALHAYRVWGAVIFWGRKSASFFLLLLGAPALARLQPEQEKRPTPNIQCRS